MSTAGGLLTAPARARDIGATAMQIFSKQASRWAERVCADEECRAFRAAVAATDVRFSCAHDSYLINLASPDPVLRARSLDAFVSELHRTDALGLDALVSHPGNYLDDRASGVARNADALIEAMSRAPGRAMVCLETTAGSGTCLGATFEELAEIIARVGGSLAQRLGVCMDTCHVYSAGYDLRADYEGVMRRLDDTIGLSHVLVVHCNDSKTAFASRRDRHELLGEGSLGIEPFRRIINDDRLVHAAKIIETPKGDDHAATDSRMLALLRGLIDAESPTPPARTRGRKPSKRPPPGPTRTRGSGKRSR
ncbi:MAG: deoxyribonuclease IV [Gemmatimonadaceae bacterium]